MTRFHSPIIEREKKLRAMRLKKMTQDKKIEYTPAPWLYDDFRAMVHKPDDQFGFFKIADCSNPTRLSVQEMNANARLIAAAPELLAEAEQTDKSYTWICEALNSLTDNADQWDADKLKNFAQSVRVQVEAYQIGTKTVIAKARGE